MAGQGRGGKRESLSLKRKMQIIEEVERNPHKQRKILADCDITISHPLLPQTHTHTDACSYKNQNKNLQYVLNRETNTSAIYKNYNNKKEPAGLFNKK